MFQQELIRERAPAFKKYLMPAGSRQRDRLAEVLPCADLEHVGGLLTELEVLEAVFKICARHIIIVDRVKFYNGVIYRVKTGAIHFVEPLQQIQRGPGGGSYLIHIMVDEPVRIKSSGHAFDSRQQARQIKMAGGGRRRGFFPA